MDPTVLQITWFALFCVLVIGYAILDGFDLGVGILSLFNRSDGERRLYVNAVAPVWDGNEVWLLTAGGALFAAFPPVYATVFSGFYLAMMLVLLGLILRAVSMEFRGKVESLAWRRFWDRMLGVGSFLPALLFGVAVGNVLRGVPIDAEGEFAGSFLGLLNPFSLLCGVLGLVMILTQGALYMAVKSDGDLRARMLGIATRTWMAWVVLFVLATLYGIFDAAHLYEGTAGSPLFWLLFLGLLGSFLWLPVAIRGDQALRAFLASSLGVGTMIGVAAVALYPNLLPATNYPSHSLTVANSSSTPATLSAMLIIALIGMPLVIGYTVFIYRVFRGKVVLDADSY